MKTLVIPDIHNDVDWVEPLIASVEPDFTVFLGDYFDHFHDGYHDALKTAKWLKSSIEKPNRKHLFGNHDVQYWHPHNPYLDCPGFDINKLIAINSVIDRKDWEDKLDLVYFEQGFVLSHAGFHPQALKFSFNEITEELIAEQCDAALRMAAGMNYHPLLDNGSRMGSLRKGGCLWLDWSELYPISGINQIVGHTPSSEWRSIVLPDSKNYCIDVMSRYTKLQGYGIIENGEFTPGYFEV